MVSLYWEKEVRSLLDFFDCGISQLMEGHGESILGKKSKVTFRFL
jgi:hypothetical protein